MAEDSEGRFDVVHVIADSEGEFRDGVESHSVIEELLEAGDGTGEVGL